MGTALGFVAGRDLRDIRAEMVSSSLLIGYVISGYSASAMAFEDRNDAERTLKGLSKVENVTAAALYDNSGRLFAAYSAPGMQPEDLTVTQPVVYQNTSYGTLMLRVSTEHLRSRTRAYLWSIALLGLGALAAALALALMLERMVSRPLLALTDVARRIAETDDYSARAIDRRNDEIGLLAAAFNRMLAEIERRQQQAHKAIQVRDDFLSVASHELKTPLTSLKLQAQGLLLAPPRSLEGADAARVKKSLDVVNRQVKRLDRLIGNLLDGSRIAAGRLMLDLAETDLCSVVDDVTKQFEAELARHNCKLERKLSGEVRGYWDSLRIDQVVTNLIANAIKYGGGKPIELRVEGGPDVARLIVRDQGIGIAPEDQPRIFGRFERAAGMAYGGLGLGLFISRQIVLAHGGTIRVESAPNRGSVFTVELPRRIEEIRNEAT